MATITLVSAVAGDRVGTYAVELAELGTTPAWVGRPLVQDFFEANNYGPSGDWAELMYVLTEDQDVPANFPILTLEIDADELAQVRAALTERAVD